MFCDKCGTKIPENETKCPNCGNVMEPEPELVAETIPPVALETAAEAIPPIAQEAVAESIPPIAQEAVAEAVAEAQSAANKNGSDVDLTSIQKEVSGIWPDWEIESLIGRGSFGEVYKARRDELGTTIYCAVKIIRIPQNLSELDSIRSEVGLDEQASTTYFKGVVDDCVNEIKLMESLKSAPNIVGIEDYKVVEGPQTGTWIIYIRMELLENFNQYAAANPLGEKEIVRLGIDICTALESCAVKDVLHRDIKPENIFKSELGGFKLGDFGIARKLESSTVGMSKKGTYNYMAPEVYNGSSEYDARSDIYSLGIVLYKLLNNNRFPFLSANASGLTYKEVLAAMEERMKGTPLPKPANASEATGSVILAACDADPNNRYVSATAFKNALMQAEAVLNGELADLDATVGTGSKLGLMAQKATAPAAEAVVSSRNVKKPVQSAKPKNRGKKVLIIALAVLIALGGLAGFIYYQWYNSVEQRALRALEKGDYEEAADILAEDSEVAEKSTIVDNLRDKISGIRAAFGNNTKDYETARMELASIRKIRNKEIESDLDEADAYLNRVNESRSIFSSAEHFMEVGDWKNAISRYQEVIEEDSNFNRAKEQLATAINNLRSEGLENAKVKADQEDYQGAIDILKMTLETLPNDEQLTKQVDIYQNAYIAKNKRDLLASAENLAAESKYIDAYNVLDKALQNGESDADIKAARQKYYDQYVNDLLAQADERIEKGDFVGAKALINNGLLHFDGEEKFSSKVKIIQDKHVQSILNDAQLKFDNEDVVGAISVLENGLRQYADEEKITTQLSAYKEQHVLQLLGEAESLVKDEEYASAISKLKEGIRLYPDEERFSVQIQTYQDQHITKIIASADEKKNDEKYSDALDDLNVGLHDYPNNERLKAKVEEIKAMLPISFKTIDSVNGDFTWNQGVPEDPFGNDYSQSGDYVIYSKSTWSREETIYKEVRLYGNYRKVTGWLSPHVNMGSRAYSYVQVYADDQLVYTSPRITRKTDTFDFSVDLRNVEYLKICLISGIDGSYDTNDSPSMILYNVLLYPN